MLPEEALLRSVCMHPAQLVALSLGMHDLRRRLDPHRAFSQARSWRQHGSMRSLVRYQEPGQVADPMSLRCIDDRKPTCDPACNCDPDGIRDYGRAFEIGCRTSSYGSDGHA